MAGRKKSKESASPRRSSRRLSREEVIDEEFEKGTKRRASQSPVGKSPTKKAPLSKAKAKAKAKAKSPSKTDKKKSVTASPQAKLILSPQKSPKSLKAKRKGGSASEGEEEEEEEAEEEGDEEVSEVSEAQEDNTLFGIIKQKRGATVVVVKEWVKRYKKDRGKAASELVNLVVSSSGSTGRVQLPSDEVDEDTIHNILDELLSDKEFKKAGGDYPYTSKKKEFRRFESHYLEFWDKLISHVSSSILFDDFFIDTIRTWLSALSGLRARSFRHVSTMTGLQLIKSIINQTVDTRKNLEVRQRQLETAQKKKKTDEEAVNQLEIQAEELQETVNQLEHLIKDLFNGIFVIRYRDAYELIRAECVKALGDWALLYPLMFLAGNYVKYIGWLLSDRASEVRLNAIKALKAIYKKSDFIAQMDQFSERFSGRISAMCFDIDSNVAKQAISVATIFAKNDLLKNDDIKRIFTLISDDNSAIRDAVADFITDLKFSDGSGSKQKKNKVAVTIRQLLDFITEYTFHVQFPNYIVDALWTKMPLLKDWAAMTDALFQEGPKGLSEVHQTLLIRLLVASVRKFTGEVICPKRPKEYDYKEVEPETNKKIVTSHLMTVLPDLLAKYKAEPKNLEELVQLPKYLLLESYQTEHQQAKFTELLQLLSEIHLQNSVDDLLLNCGAAFQFLLSVNYWGKAEAKIVFNQLVESLSNTLISEINGELDEVALEVCLNRIAQLYIQINLGKIFDFYDPIKVIVSSLQVKSDKQFSEKAVIHAVSIMTQHLLWVATSEISDSHDFVEKREIFFQNLEHILRNPNGSISQPIRESAFYKACDLIVVFASVQHHRYRPTSELITSIVNYFEEQIEEAKPEPETINRKELLITTFARLVVSEPSDRFSERYAPSLLVHLVVHSKRIDEILKITLKTIREREKANEWEIVFATLKKRYMICKEKYNSSRELGEEIIEAPFQDLEELAVRLYYSYGIKIPASQKNSPGYIVTEGINFAIPEKKEEDETIEPEKLTTEIPFLSALTPFTSRLSNYASELVELFASRSKDIDKKALSKEERKAFDNFKDHLERSGEKEGSGRRKKPLSVIPAREANLEHNFGEEEEIDDSEEKLRPKKRSKRKSAKRANTIEEESQDEKDEQEHEGTDEEHDEEENDEEEDDEANEERTEWSGQGEKNNQISPQKINSQEHPTKPRKRRYPIDDPSQQSSQEEPSARRTRSRSRGK